MTEMARVVGKDGVSRGAGWEGVIENHGYYEGSGVVEGHPWYLHARGWRWAVAVAGPGQNAVDVVFGEVDGYYHEERHADPAGMTEEEIWGCLEQCLEEFRQIGFNVQAGEIHDPVLRGFAGISG
jgi:hypothetical protein